MLHIGITPTPTASYFYCWILLQDHPSSNPALLSAGGWVSPRSYKPSFPEVCLLPSGSTTARTALQCPSGSNPPVSLNLLQLLHGHLTRHPSSALLALCASPPTLPREQRLAVCALDMLVSEGSCWVSFAFILRQTRPLTNSVTIQYQNKTGNGNGNYLMVEGFLW